MTYLLIAVLLSSAIGIIFKLSEGRFSNRYIVTSVNYLTAFLFSGYLLSKSGILNNPPDLTFVGFFSRWAPLFASTSSQLSSADSFIWAVGLGIVTGWFYFTAFIVYQISVQKNGIALSGMFSRLGILVPVSISVFLWHEIPTLIQFAGIILCLVSIVIVNLNFKEGETFAINGSLILLFCAFGCSIFFNKIFQKYALLELKPLFLFCVFSSALLVSLSASIKSVRSVKKSEIIFGVLVGIPNLFTSWFLIQALAQIKASIVFPVFSAGSIILMTVVAVIFLGERIHLKNGLAILLTSIALVMMHLSI